ncbi:hypothetical protein PPL_01089 [Heterostelium album PN500]|uniref:Uncharacterized protein n=1 Tax=Heterostelium pallidum (strain ATCC 26659 / Pp 5 / PN500) TaxID=670386 RepID=D3AY30_HETP5|nr:hypothetical protein PPL_01089 [Heterostelium album PN500]EFA85857.1 hypothetical protein PPL_01089 [Heterostelium album PN500]|eukprot:XP_020437963.1 hypothetical protein PPL_01089 [Heterostelium album PN500]
MTTLNIDLNSYNDCIIDNFESETFNKLVVDHHRDDLNESNTVLDVAEGNLIYLALAGSQSFNLHINGSDQDFIGVREAPIDVVLSLDGPKDTIHHLKPDISIYELRHYCKLLLMGNPKQIEALYTKDMCYISEEWQHLQRIKRKLITLVSIDHYYNTIKALHYDLKYMSKERSLSLDGNANEESNEKKRRKHQKMVENNKVQSIINQKKQEDANLEVGNTFHKKAYHSIRLLTEVNRLLDGLDPIVRFEDSSLERQLILTIRKEEIPDKELMELIDSKYSEFEFKRQSIDTSSLPEEVDIDLVNKWLVNIRRKAIDQDKSDRFNFNSNQGGQSIKQQADNLLLKNGIRGQVIYVGISGSHLFNLSTNSDESQLYDYVGVYAADTDDVVSLCPPPIKIDQESVSKSSEYIPRNHKPAPSPVATKKDITTRGMILYEVGYAISLFINGNYRLFEQLFVDERITQRYTTDAWLELLSNKSFYSNRTMAQANWGVGQAEYMKARQLLGLKKIITNKRALKKLSADATKYENETIGEKVTDNDIKLASRCLYYSFRLLWVSKQILNGSKSPSLYFENDSEERNLLLQLKDGLINRETIMTSIENCKSLMEETSESLEILKTICKSDELESQTKTLLNPWLIKIRKSL